MSAVGQPLPMFHFKETPPFLSYLVTGGLTPRWCWLERRAGFSWAVIGWGGHKASWRTHWGILLAWPPTTCWTRPGTIPRGSWTQRRSKEERWAQLKEMANEDSNFNKSRAWQCLEHCRWESNIWALWLFGTNWCYICELHEFINKCVYICKGLRV